MASENQSDAVDLLQMYAETYDNYPDLASNVAIDAKEAGQSDRVINFFESLGDTYLEGSDQVSAMITQIDDES